MGVFVKMSLRIKAKISFDLTLCFKERVKNIRETKRKFLAFIFGTSYMSNKEHNTAKEIFLKNSHSTTYNRLRKGYRKEIVESVEIGV